MAKYLTVLSPWDKTAGHNSMSIATDYPAEWTDITGQFDRDIADGLTMFVAFGTVSDAQATTIAADAKYVILSNVTKPEEGVATPTPPDLTAPQVTALKSTLTTKISADVAALAVESTVKPEQIVSRIIDAQKRPPWRIGVDVKVGDVYTYERNLYEVIQAHKTQSDWTPVVAKSLYKRFYEPTDAPWPWVQPTGAHDAYPVGARVTYGGFTWRNDIPANVWQPGVTGWTNLTPPPPTSAWAVGVAYKVNDEVTYQGSTYRCRQAHTSIVTWTPPATPALWLKL